jgi:TPR repeat protein
MRYSAVLAFDANLRIFGDFFLVVFKGSVVQIMKTIYLSVVLLLLGVLASCATVKSNGGGLAFLIQTDELVFREKIGDKTKFEADLRAAHNQLDKKIELNRFADERSRIWSHYLRGMSGQRLLGFDFENERPIDSRLAIQTIKDFDVTASADERLTTSIGTSVSSAMYSAALITLNSLKDELKAHEYFERCADLGHAGCANVVAEGAQRGKYGQKINVEKSVRYHKKVAETGTRFRCAGSFSSSSIAQLAFFEGVNTPEGDELFWIKQSIHLAKEVTTNMGVVTSCYLHDTENDQYLYQLARGVPATQPVGTHERPEKYTQQVGSWALGKLILGNMNQSEFDIIVADETKASARCGNWFSAALLYSLRGDEVSKNKYRSRILMEDEKECVMSRRYLNKIETPRSRVN